MKLIKPTIVLPGLCALACAIIALAGCGTFGSNPSPPNAVERALFTTVTNYVPATNYVTTTVPQYTTNTVTITNVVQQPGQPPAQVIVTNEVTRTNFVTQTVAQVTNVPSYTLTPSPSTQSGISTIGSAVNTFFPGVGGIVGYGLAALVGAWGYFRSSKLGNTSNTLSQEIETILEFAGALPNGQQYVTTIQQWLQAHQNETGVASQVLSILENDVSNPDAKVAAQQLINTINALNAQGPTPVAKPVIGPVPLG